ncbi:MAG: hypothetical protein HUJ68_11980 [Clostridia bacterium]|nr:hypothetical protein [Clostridia bacterium]
MNKTYNRYKAQKNKIRTSLGNPYIHLDPSDNNILGRAQEAYNDSAMLNKIATISSPKRLGVDTKNLENSIELIENLKKGKAFGNTIENKLKSNSKSIFSSNLVQSLTNDITNRTQKSSSLFKKGLNGKLNNLQSLLDFYEEIIRDSKITFNETAISNMINSFIISSDITGKKFNEEYQKFVGLNGKIISVSDGSFRSAKTTSENLISKFKIYTSLLQRIKGELEGGSIGKENDLVDNIINATSAIATQLGQSVYENIVSEATNLYETEIDNFLKTIKNNSSKNVKITITGNQKTSNIAKSSNNNNINTKNLKVNVNKKNKSIEANVSINIPTNSGAGASRQTANKNFQVIDLENQSSSVGSLLSTEKGFEYRYLLSNLAFNSSTAEGVYTQLALNKMTNSLLKASAGNKTLAYIKNGKATSVYEYVRDLTNRKNFVMSSDFKNLPNLNTLKKIGKGQTIEEAADQRSEEMYDRFLNSKIKLR